MKETKPITGADNYTAVNFGKLNEIQDYVLQLPAGVSIPGKVFGGQSVNATGAEFSFQSLAPGQGGLLHTHKTHEELYFFLGGDGEFQVDNDIFPVTEGSVVRVAPSAKRTLRNNSDKPLLMLCVQYRADTFTAEDALDGVIL